MIKEYTMLKLISGIAALTFISACTTTTTGADLRPSTATLGAGPAVATQQGFGPSVGELGSGPGLNSIYLPGPN